MTGAYGGALFEVGCGGAAAGISRGRTQGTARTNSRSGGGGGGLGIPGLDDGGFAAAAYPIAFESYASDRGRQTEGVDYLGGNRGNRHNGGMGIGNQDGDLGTGPERLEEIQGGIVGGAAAMYGSRISGGGGIGSCGQGAPGSDTTSFDSSAIVANQGRSTAPFGGSNGETEEDLSYSGSADYSAGGLGYPDVRSGMVGGGFRNIIGNKFARGSSDGAAAAAAAPGGGRAGTGGALRYDGGRGSYPVGGGGGGGDPDYRGLPTVTSRSAAAEFYGVAIGSDVGGLPVATATDKSHRNLNRICDTPGGGLLCGPGVKDGADALTPGGSSGDAAAVVAVAFGGEGVEEEEGAEGDSDEDVEEEPLAGWTEVDGWTFSGLPLEGEKVGKPSSRELIGPMHVFEGKRKLGKSGWPTGITWMVSETYKGSLEGIEWPPSLIGIVLTGFNRPISKVSWPKGLQELHLRGPFDQAVQDARFPDSLKTLSFGACFNHPVEDASFPEALEGLYFGDSDKGYERALFNQPLAGITWPPALKQLSAGQAFQQSLEGADWPDTLEVINIMGSKKQPVEDIEWPPGLKQIHLNGRCRKEAPKAAWPRGCKVFAWSFSRKAAMAHPPKFGITNVGLSNFSGHNMEQIMFEY